MTEKGKTISNRSWLSVKGWETPTIRGISAGSILSWWCWSFLLLIILGFLYYNLYPGIVQTDDLFKRYAFIFLVVIFSMLWAFPIMALRTTLDYLRFGPTDLTMDPHPGSIGGQVGSIVESNMDFEPNMNCIATLMLSFHTPKVSGRSTRIVKWKDTRPALAEPSSLETRSTMLFDVPSTLRE